MKNCRITVRFCKKPVKTGHLAKTIRQELDIPLTLNTEDSDEVKNYDYA
jgi:hypothetical protein